jgi:hypothetical protein
MADLKRPVQGAGKLEKVNSRPHVSLVSFSGNDVVVAGLAHLAHV